MENLLCFVIDQFGDGKMNEWELVEIVVEWRLVGKISCFFSVMILNLVMVFVGVLDY